MLGFLGGVKDIVAMDGRNKFSGRVMGLKKGGGDRSGVNLHDCLGHVKCPSVMIIPSGDGVTPSRIHRDGGGNRGFPRGGEMTTLLGISKIKEGLP